MNNEFLIIATIIGPILGAGFGVWLSTIWDKKTKVICYSSQITDFKIDKESYLITDASINLLKLNDMAEPIIKKLESMKKSTPFIKSVFIEELDNLVGDLLSEDQKALIIQNSLLTPNIDLYTHSIVIRNAGKKVATNIRIGHNFLPINFKILPTADFSIRELQDKKKEILINKLVPGEQITISYLYFYPYTLDQIHSFFKYDDGFIKIINVLIQRQYPKPLLFIYLFLMLMGTAFIIYLIFKIISAFL